MEPFAAEQYVGSDIKQEIERLAHMRILMPQSNEWSKALHKFLSPNKLILDDVLFEAGQRIVVSPLEHFPTDNLSEPFNATFCPDLATRSFKLHIAYHDKLAFSLNLTQPENSAVSIIFEEVETLPLTPEERNNILLLSILSVTKALYEPRTEENSRETEFAGETVQVNTELL